MKNLRRIGVVAATVLGLLAVAVPASAHVTVNPKEAVQGGYARLAFRVPNESDTAATTKLEVHLPDNAPVASVSTMPVPGWTVAVTKRKLDQPVQVHGNPVSEVVSVITWTATGAAAIKPGQFQEFPVSMGPLPEVDKMVFKSLQTYSDGNIVRWIDEPTNDAGEPENPAPVLKLTPKGAAPGAAVAAGPKADDEGMDWLGLAALVTALLALGAAGLALARQRSRSDALQRQPQ
jgi:uncharacterized protein YcnI